MVLGKLDSACKSMNSLTPCTKINSKWLKDLNIRHNTIKLEGSVSSTFSDIKHINVLSQSPKAIAIKPKISKWNLIKLTSFCIAKETVNEKKNKTKRQPEEWEKIFAK